MLQASEQTTGRTYRETKKARREAAARSVLAGMNVPAGYDAAKLDALVRKAATPYKHAAWTPGPSTAATIREITRAVECLDPGCSGRAENADRGASFWIGSRHFHEEPTGLVKCPSCSRAIPLATWWNHGCGQPAAVLVPHPAEPLRAAPRTEPAWKCWTCGMERFTGPSGVPHRCPSCYSDTDDRHGPHALAV